jgi:hypothetical protein
MDIFKFIFHIFQSCRINPLRTKCNPFYLKTQSVPRSKHHLGCKNQSLNAVRAKFAVCSEVHTKRIKYTAGRMWNFGMINEAVRTGTAGL